MKERKRDEGIKTTCIKTHIILNSSNKWSFSYTIITMASRITSTNPLKLFLLSSKLQVQTKKFYY